MRTVVSIVAVLVTTAVVLLHVSAATAQPIETKRVSFAAGTSSASLQGTLRGDQIVDYVLGASIGQTMVVSMSTSNPSAYFNIVLQGAPEALHVGSIAGLDFNGSLPASGDWVIRVYLQRNAARRGESAGYDISVSIVGDGGGGGGGGTAPTGDDFADGDAGGPDYWSVTGVPAGDELNVRGGPGTGNPVVARVGNGQALRTLGCQSSGNSRWCHVETPDGGISGWVSGAYLREGAAPSGGGSAITIPSDGVIVPDLNFRPTGEIEAAWSSGCTVLYNPTGRQINAGSSCSQAQLIASDLWVTRALR